MLFDWKIIVRPSIHSNHRFKMALFGTIQSTRNVPKVKCRNFQYTLYSISIQKPFIICHGIWIAIIFWFDSFVRFVLFWLNLWALSCAFWNAPHHTHSLTHCVVKIFYARSLYHQPNQAEYFLFSSLECHVHTHKSTSNLFCWSNLCYGWNAKKV